MHSYCFSSHIHVKHKQEMSVLNDLRMKSVTHERLLFAFNPEVMEQGHLLFMP